MSSRHNALQTTVASPQVIQGPQPLVNPPPAPPKLSPHELQLITEAAAKQGPNGKHQTQPAGVWGRGFVVITVIVSAGWLLIKEPWLSPAQYSLTNAELWPKTPFISFIYRTSGASMVQW